MRDDDDDGMNGAAMASPFEGADGLFVFDAEPIVEWPVRVKYPVAGGAVRVAEIPMDLQYVSGGDLNDALIACQKLEPAAFGTEDDPLAGFVRGWRGIAKPGGDGELPCTAATKRVLLARTNVRGAVIDALVQMANGAEVKNSATPPAAGPNRARRRAAAAKAKRAN